MSPAAESLVLQGIVRVVGLSLAGGAVAVVAAALYRWYARTAMPLPLPTLLSLGVVAAYLNTTGALSAVIGGQRGLLDLEVVVVNAATLLGAVVVVPAAVRVGDRFALAVTTVSGTRTLDGDVGTIVRSVGRVITVDLPDTVDDVEGYDPVPDGKKAEFAGRTLVFPRGLTVSALRERLVARLKADFGVGHVDVELADDGTVEHLGVGSRAAGLGPTLPPRTVAVAVHADPAFAASPGDRVQVYRPGSPPERVAAGELRAVADDVVTLAVDAADAPVLDDTTRYRLATLPATPRPENEFAGLLRAADETMGVVSVAPDGPIDGAPVGSLGVAVVAVRAGPTEEGGQAGPVEAVPARNRVLTAGDTVYAIGRPEVLRRLETAASGR